MNIKDQAILHVKALSQLAEMDKKLTTGNLTNYAETIIEITEPVVVKVFETFGWEPETLKKEHVHVIMPMGMEVPELQENTFF